MLRPGNTEGYGSNAGPDKSNGNTHKDLGGINNRWVLGEQQDRDGCCANQQGTGGEEEPFAAGVVYKSAGGGLKGNGGQRPDGKDYADVPGTNAGL